MKANQSPTWPNQIAAHYNFIKYWAQKYMKDPDDINDLTQSVVLRALTNEHNFEAGTNLKAWLKVMVYSQFISEYRATKRRGAKVELNDGLYDKGVFETFVTNVAFQSFANEDLKARISLLPDSLQQIMRLRAVGYKYEEIAAILDISMGTVRSRIHYAKQEMAL